MIKTINLMYLLALFLLVLPFITVQAVDQEELKRLKINSYQNNGKKKSRGKESTIKIEVEEINLPSKVKLKNYPNVPKISIKDGNFYKNGKPVYLIGAECNAQTRHPFLWRLLNFDFIQIVGPVYSKQTMLCKKNGDTVKISWKENHDLERDVRLILEAGFPVYTHLIEGHPSYIRANFPLLRDADELLVDNGHFYSMCWENPTAAKIRRNFFKSMIRSMMSYPVFAVELFNEVSFVDYGKEALTAFRQFCTKKYGSVNKANQAWKTSYKNFSEMQVPKVIGINASFDSMPRNTSRMLWRDWREFCGKYSAQAFGQMAKLVGRHMPKTNITVQSHCDYMFDMAPSGIDPLEKSKIEDFYGDESRYILYRQYTGRENISQLAQMVGSLLWRDYLSHLIPNKPQISEETYPKSGRPESINFINLHNSKWSFKSDNEDIGVKAGYYNFNFDDKSWDKIKVPGMWANSGHEKTHTGWYRMAFNINRDNIPEQLLLNGHELADKANIYVNGKKIHRTRRWKDSFSLNLAPILRNGKNVIAIRIINKYFKAGRYWGGIRGGISLGLTSNHAPALTQGQMRSFFWERWLHGENGVVISYAYSAEGGNHSIFYPKRIERVALRAIPQTKNEINAIAPLVAPHKQRIPAKAAICFPMETMRFHIFKNYKNLISAPITTDVSLWYAALLTSGVPSAVIPNSTLENKNELAKYSVIITRRNTRISQKGFNNLVKFVKDGGTLISDRESLTRDDRTNKTLNASIFNKTLGKVHIIPSSLSKVKCFKLLRKLIVKASKPDVTIKTNKKAITYIERYLLGKNDRYLLYLHNWGGKRVVKAMPNVLPNGNYRISDLSSGKIINPKISGRKLRRSGIAVDLPCQTPRVFIVEKMSLSPLEVKRLSQDQLQWFDFMAGNPRVNPVSSNRILFSGGQLCYYSKIFLLTAAKTLEKIGYSTDLALPPINTDNMTVFTNTLTQAKLSDYKILFLGGPRIIKAKESKAILDFVKNGGGLFICGNWSRGPHKWLSNSHVNKSFLKQLGAAVVNVGIKDKVNFTDNEQWHPVFKDFTNHKLTQNIKSIYSQGMGFLSIKKEIWESLVLSGKNSNYPGKAVVAVRQYGKGRIVLCGDSAWLKPAMLSQGDNKRFLINLIKWLSKK
jgi:glycosyl hydrolase family 42 (putative beta-galactosidase)/uncharacterized protein DUF4350